MRALEAGVIQPGSYDLWSFMGLEEGGQIVCGSPLSLIYYACSASTWMIQAGAHQPKLKTIEITVFGPAADYPDRDGEQRMYVRCWMSKSALLNCHAMERLAFCDALDAKVLKNPGWDKYKSTLEPQKIKEILGLPIR